MKNLIVVSTLIVLCSMFPGCKDKDVNKQPVIKTGQIEPSNDESFTIEWNGDKNQIDPKATSAIVISDLSDDVIKIEDAHSDYKIDDKEYTSDELRKYLNGLCKNKLKYGILMTYIKGGSFDAYSETVLKHFCLKNDVDLFSHAPVNRMPVEGELYPNFYAFWSNKSSDSYYAKDEFYKKVYMNGLGEMAEDKLPKNVLKITESESEHYIIDEKKYTAKELIEYLDKFSFKDLDDGILLTMNDVKKNEEACFYALWQFVGRQNVDLYLQKTFVKQDSPKFGKIQYLHRSNRNYVRDKLSQLKVDENLVLSQIASYKTKTELSRYSFQDAYYSNGRKKQETDKLVEYLYERLNEKLLERGLDLGCRLENSIEDTCFPKIVMFCIKNDVNIYMDTDKKLITGDDFFGQVFLDEWFYKAIKPQDFDYDFVKKIYNNGVDEILLTDLAEDILTFTELNTLKYKASDKEYNAEDLNKYLQSLKPEALKSGILLKTNKTKKADFPCFLVLEDFCVKNNVKLYIQRPAIDEKSPKNKLAFIYSNKVKTQSQEVEKKLDASKNEVLLSKISHKSTYIEIDEYFSDTDWEKMKQALEQIDVGEQNYGVFVRVLFRDKFTQTKPYYYVRDFCNDNDIDLFVFYYRTGSKKSTEIKDSTVAIWDVKSSKSQYLDDDYMRKVHEND